MPGITYIVVGLLFLLLFVGLFVMQKIRRREQAYREIAENVGRDPKDLPVPEEEMSESGAVHLAEETENEKAEDMTDSDVRRKFEEATKE